jgi:hypothetical protein
MLFMCAAAIGITAAFIGIALILVGLFPCPDMLFMASALSTAAVSAIAAAGR